MGMVIKNGERLLLRLGDVFRLPHQGWAAEDMLGKNEQRNFLMTPKYHLRLYCNKKFFSLI
jgi:hypothetical protein